MHGLVLCQVFFFGFFLDKNVIIYTNFHLTKNTWHDITIPKCIKSFFIGGNGMRQKLSLMLILLSVFIMSILPANVSAEQAAAEQYRQIV